MAEPPMRSAATFAAAVPVAPRHAPPAELEAELDAIPQEMASCLQGTMLDLSRLDDKRVATLSPAAWGALDALARRQSGTGITTVLLPRPTKAGAGDLKHVCAGLDALPSLTTLTLPVPLEGEDIDLQDLSYRPAGLTVLLACDHPVPEREFQGGWQIDVKAPCEVRACGEAAAHAHLRKAKVRVHGSGGSSPQVHTLAGFNYFRTLRDAKAFPRSPDKIKAGLSPEMAAVQLNLNAQAYFQLPPVPSAAGHKPPIVCRHLAVQWLTDRESRAQRKDEARKDGKLAVEHQFRMTKYRTRTDLSGHVGHATEKRFLELFMKQPAAEFSPTRFGVTLSKLAASMQPPAARRFLLVTPNHAMGVELQAKTGKDGKPRFALVVYDPNNTATYRRQVFTSLEALARQTLAQSLKLYGTGPGADELMKTYFPADRPQAAQLMEWPLEQPATGPTVVELDEGGKAGAGQPTFVRGAMSLWTPEVVTAGVQAARKAHAGQPQQLEACLRGVSDPQQPTALAWGAGMRRWPAVIGYVRALLQIPRNELPRLSHFQLLQELRRPVLQSMLTAPGAPAATADFARTILDDATADALTTAQRLALLRAVPAAGGQPALHACVQGVDAVHEEANRMSAYHLAREVAASRTLTLRQKRDFLSTRHGGWWSGCTAAAQALKSGNPQAALAMVAGILDARATPGDTQALLKSLGIDVAALVLQHMPKTEGHGASHWLSSVREALLEHRLQGGGFRPAYQRAAAIKWT